MSGDSSSKTGGSKARSKVVEELALAMQTEVDGHAFYTHAAKLVSDERGRNFFIHLAKDELDHMRAVKTIAESLKEGRGWLGYDEALTASKSEGLPVFPETNELIERLKGNESDLHALEISMEIEEAAIETYRSMLDGAEGDEERGLLEKLLEMEKGHLTLLRWEKDSLTDDGFWCDHMEYSVEKEKD